MVKMAKIALMSQKESVKELCECKCVFHLSLPEASTASFALNFGVSARWYRQQNQSPTSNFVTARSGLGVLTPPVLPMSTDLTGCPYNTINVKKTVVL